MSANVIDRAGFQLGSQSCPGNVVMPNGASLDDGLDDDEAILIALWNNAAFQQLLCDLDIARGELIQAGLLPNPEVAYFFSVPDKPFKYALDMPLEAFWLRPNRVAAAERESARVCDQLTQAALDLIRDVRQSLADVRLAQGQLRVAEEAVRIRARIAQLAQARLEAGDVSVQEAATARIDAIQATQDTVRATADLMVADERLRNLLGIGAIRTPLRINDARPLPPHSTDVETLTAEATHRRPDVLAADQAVAAAAERVRLSKLNWVRFLGVLDATSGRGTGHEFGPAFRATLPVFNWNQGAIARAEAECSRAVRQRQTIREQIILEVRQAEFRLRQAQDELEIFNTRIRPEVDAAIRRAESGYREGETTYLIVLETTRQFLDSQLREQQLQAEYRRAWAELERSVGRHLDGTSETVNLEERAS
ncbi:MAG: TolC family protein [Planctomycetota bacterium]